jgi:hypothetical protein
MLMEYSVLHHINMKNMYHQVLRVHGSTLAAAEASGHAADFN